ncbi:MAG TPA: hypothetical protein VGT08_01175 [Terracidiphilus sp.]|nr:hypothetical protein [Terracidiphilus sp.]
MKTQSEAEKAKAEDQALAMIEFERLISRPVPHVRWYDGGMPEPAEYRRWRLYSSLLYRVELWLDSGLPRWDGMLAMVEDARACAKEARREWLKIKHRLSARYAAGKGPRPPWGMTK